MDDLPNFPGPGRPSKFNEERAEKLIQAVRGGNHFSVACKFAGIHYQTLRRWLLKADDPGAPEEYREFKEAIEKAQADAEVAALAKIQKAASDGQWQAAAWYLERSSPDRWGRKDKAQLEVTGPDGGPLKVVGGIELNTDSMKALAQRLAARAIEDAAEDIVDAELVEASAVPDSPAALHHPDYMDDEIGEGDDE